MHGTLQDRYEEKITFCQRIYMHGTTLQDLDLFSYCYHYILILKRDLIKFDYN